MEYIITEEQFSTIQTNNPGSIIRMVRKFYNSMNMEGICELDVGYDEEDNNFHCYLIIDRDWYTENPLEKNLKNAIILFNNKYILPHNSITLRDFIKIYKYANIDELFKKGFPFIITYTESILNLYDNILVRNQDD